MTKIQKLSVDAGFTCPNRDGSKGRGGCTFCANEAFSPSYLRAHKGIAEQLEAGKLFFEGKYPDMGYIAYFQSYSNTYAPVDVLRERYSQALSVDGVRGLVIGTRPDCLGTDVLDLLEELNGRTSLMVELGVESFNDRTLQRVNRCHDAACSAGAVNALAARGIRVGVHLIFGLPGESREDMLGQAEILNALPVSTLKIHQLQILEGTAMAREWKLHPESFDLMDVDSYARLVAEFVRRLKPGIRLERFAAQAPPDMVLAPRWGLKPQEVQKRISTLLDLLGSEL